MDQNKFMHPDGSPKTAFEMFLDSCSPLSFSSWKLSVEQQAHVEKFWGERRVGTPLTLLQRAA